PDLETLPSPKTLVDGPWYIAIGTNIRGPMPLDQVKEHIARRELTPDCLIWKEGMKDWELAKNVRPIAVLFGVAAAKGPREGLPFRSETTRAGQIELDGELPRRGSEENGGATEAETMVVHSAKILVPRDEYPQIDGYTIDAVLGKGGMGVVYRATQVAMDRPVAIKVLAGKYASNQTFVGRFLKEARASARLSHPNIIQGIDVREAQGKYCFIMEYVDGQRIGDILRRGGAMDPARALNIVIQVARSLEHAHKNGIIHRDVKPDNLMLTKDGQAKLCDLGMVKLAEEDPTAPGQITGGTPNYLSPEQARGEPTVDHRADIYCLGGTFYHMVVGAVPFTGLTRSDIVKKHLNEQPVPPDKRNPSVSPKMSAVILKMMSKDAGERYANATELIKDLTLLSMGSTPMAAGGPAADAPSPAASPAARPRMTSRPTRLPSRPSRRRRLR
ncbi:MAG: protein kinase, partial [Planctomycetes bacterium]|nr:protein kinase [Planctomycetota bacterium]